MINNVTNGASPAVREREVVASNRSQAPAAPELQPKDVESIEQDTPQQASAAEPESLQSAVSKLNDFVQNVQRTLSFSVEETTGITVVQVYDSETDELIRQIPAEETIKLAASIEAFNTSLFIKEQA